MSAFFGYILAPLNPSVWVHYITVLPKLLGTLLPTFGPLLIIIVIEFLYYRVGVFVLWFSTLVRPSFVYPPEPSRRPGTEPLVSVIIPGWNEERSIAATLESALHCGYPNLEIVFVDDGSSDRTLEEARRIAARVGRGGGRPKIRIFSGPRSGKAGALNTGLCLARGEFIAVIDADSELQHGAIHHLLAPLADPRVGAVAANIRVLNPTRNLLTRIVECEFSFRMTLNRLLVARLGLLSLIPGPGGLFRAEAVRAIGGYDPGLGEDGDITLRLLKAGWKLGFSLDGIVYTTVPETWAGLARQRARWARNTVMIRLSKHSDMLLPTGRYGYVNMLIAYMTVNRLVIAFTTILVGAVILAEDPSSRPILLTNLYWLAVLLTALKVAIVRDIAGIPPLRSYLVVPLIPLYRVFLLVVTMTTTLRELLRLNSRHPYVPVQLWPEIPRW